MKKIETVPTDLTEDFDEFAELVNVEIDPETGEYIVTDDAIDSAFEENDYDEHAEFLDGLGARAAGQSKHENPYPYNTRQWRAWLDGWCDGEELGLYEYEQGLEEEDDSW